jgi:hypothetical protein
MDNATDRDLLRHALATVAYRAAKALRATPDDFGDFRVGPTSRTPSEILGHMGDLMVWALRMAEGAPTWSEVEADAWTAQRDRFFEALGALDAYLASDAPLAHEPAKLLQGPIADALTHVGQIAMLRRLAGAAVRGENYFKAMVQAGQVGPDQPPPVYEFD